MKMLIGPSDQVWCMVHNSTTPQPQLLLVYARIHYMVREMYLHFTEHYTLTVRSFDFVVVVVDFVISDFFCRDFLNFL